MSSDDDFDAAAYKEFEDRLYEEHSLSGSDGDLDSEVEETLYSQVHYASSLLVSENSTPGERTPKTRNLLVNSLDVKGEKCHLDSSVIEISSDDDDNDDDDEGNNKDVDSEDYIDNCEDVQLSSSLNYPEVVKIFADNDNLTSSKESPLARSEAEPGKITENWNLHEKDLEDSKMTKQRLRYYAPGKGLPHVRCYNCNEKGHLSQNCPEPKKISVCFLCGGVGHVKRSCPNELCFNCYEPGHMSKQCRKPRRRPYDRCNRCHVLGHLANDCPDRWRQYHLTIQVGPVVRPTKPVPPPQTVYCYNCGSQGHYGHECQEENETRRHELPLPFVVNYDSCQMSAFRQKKNFDKRPPKRRPNNERRNQAVSQGFYDQARQEDYDETESRFYQPPPEKIPRINDDADVRRVSFQGDSYKTSEYNAPYTDRTPKRKKKKNKKEDIRRGDERIVEFLEPSPPDVGLIEEPYQPKKKKGKKRLKTIATVRGKQHWQGDRFKDNFDSFNFNARNNFQHRNEPRFSNPNRNEDYRSFEDMEFDSRRTSSNPRKRKRDFVSDRGFRFNNEPRRKNSNPQYLKRYTF